ncbi:nitrilase family protein [Cupriavidus pampae]|uniref:N-carbamoyl-D-amino acid hydrolase n=1 Tax=Cupriavidus pampae TaxID=659251 RepID=A0ABM8XW83_9BURK|nr:nitrilase family protein [Cupriavidus pampae]CAG9184607.1 N-carbamoyl-D-amino acid hydrolase [Cupriavidus pampae]
MSLLGNHNEPSPFPPTTVASIQMAPRVGCKDENLARSLAMIEQAAARGARLVVLPELANSGYVFASRAEAFALAEPVPDGPSTQAWIEAARRHDIHIVSGIAERDGERLYNSAVLVSAKGHLGTYRKLHLWGDENLFFEPGDKGLPVFHTEMGRLGIVVCYDGWFPETFRLLAMQGADIVAMPTNWVPMPNQPADRPAMANTLAMAGAHSNGLTIVCANRVGTERGQPFIGQSLIVGADGWPMAGPASLDSEEILYARIDLSVARRGRQLNDFNHVLRDRREDLYDAMLGMPTSTPRQ